MNYIKEKMGEISFLLGIVNLLAFWGIGYWIGCINIHPYVRGAINELIIVCSMCLAILAFFMGNHAKRKKSKGAWALIGMIIAILEICGNIFMIQVVINMDFMV